MTTIKWHIIKSNKDLPRAGKYVLVTRVVHGRRIVDVDTPFPKNFCVSERDTYEDWVSTYEGKVIAWAELPKPYQGKLK